MGRLDSELLNYESKYLEGNVLKNELGIDNEEALNKAERLITTRRLAQMYLEENKIDFKPEYYLNIHKEIFDGIYSFAGEIRNEIIAKRITFCPPAQVYINLKKVFNELNVLADRINNREDLLKVIVEYYAELDVIHPFREGNGRTEREFMRRYIDYVCQINELEEYYLDYAKIEDNDCFIDAVVSADMCNYVKLYDLFDDILSTKEKKGEKTRKVR